MKLHIISALLAISFLHLHHTVATGVNETTITTVAPEKPNATAAAIDINDQTFSDVVVSTLPNQVPEKSTTPPTSSVAPTEPVPTTLPTTKPKPPSPTPTVTPAPTTESPTTATSGVPVQPSSTANPHARGRKFDGPSFIGGIILASGLTAIGFIAFKFYKARTELNYHTL